MVKVNSFTMVGDYSRPLGWRQEATIVTKRFWNSTIVC